LRPDGLQTLSGARIRHATLTGLDGAPSWRDKTRGSCQPPTKRLRRCGAFYNSRRRRLPPKTRDLIRDDVIEWLLLRRCAKGYIQFDLEQLRCAMQAVEDFVLKNVGISAEHCETGKASNASRTRRRHVHHAVHV
jgi:hypothetical protein